MGHLFDEEWYNSKLINREGKNIFLLEELALVRKGCGRKNEKEERQ